MFSELWDRVTEFFSRPFRDCTNMCDIVERPFGGAPGSPGVQVLPQHFPRMDRDRDLKYDLSAGPISSSSQVSNASRSGSSRSKTSNDSFYSYDDPYDQPTQFLFYCGSESLTPSSAEAAARAASNGWRSDAISTTPYVLGLQNEGPATPRTPIVSPSISHQIPIFFSPRNAPTSPAAVPMYSPHLFRITEHENDPYFMRFSR